MAVLTTWDAKKWGRCVAKWKYNLDWVKERKLKFTHPGRASINLGLKYFRLSFVFQRQFFILEIKRTVEMFRFLIRGVIATFWYQTPVYNSYRIQSKLLDCMLWVLFAGDVDCGPVFASPGGNASVIMQLLYPYSSTAKQQPSVIMLLVPSELSEHQQLQIDDNVNSNLLSIRQWERMTTAGGETTICLIGIIHRWNTV